MVQMVLRRVILYMFTTKIFNVQAVMKMATKYEYGHRHALKYSWQSRAITHSTDIKSMNIAVTFMYLDIWIYIYIRFYMWGTRL